MLKRKLIAIVFPVLFAVFGSSAAVSGQFDTATVVGTVRDNSGAVVPGVTVTLTGLDTGIATTKVTDENGNFEFQTVRIGRYKVTAELTGFSIALADNVPAPTPGRSSDSRRSTPSTGPTFAARTATGVWERSAPSRPPTTHASCSWV